MSARGDDQEWRTEQEAREGREGRGDQPPAALEARKHGGEGNGRSAQIRDERGPWVALELPGLWGDFSLTRIAAISSALDEAGGLSETV